MKTTKTILTKIVHILIVIFAGKTPAFFTETVAQGTTVSGEIVAPKEWDGLNRNNQRVFGTVTDTVLRGDSQNYSPPNWAQQDVFRGGYTKNITVENTGNQDIFGGTAENTVIKDEGRATLKNQGIFKDGKVYKGGFFSAQSGTVDNINVYENGQFDISGDDNGVIVEGGEITYLAKGSIFQGRAKINDLKISGNVVVSDNGLKYSPDFSRAHIKPGGLLRLSSGRMINSRVEEGSLSVFEDGSEASDTIMIKARTKVEKRGTLKRTQMTGGSLDIKERGLAEAIVVNGGGRMSNYSGTDIGTVVNSGTYTLGDAHSTTAQSNNLTLESGATAYIRDGILNGATLNGGLMILVDDGLSSTLKGNVTVGERGQLNVINNGHLDTHNANLNLSGRVRLKNDADFGTLLMNNGHFYFDSDSNADSKLSVETLSGSGTFWMNTDIAGHKGDFLHVRGEANGHFGVRVTDTGESPKAEDSLKIIQTGGGEAKFTLANQGQVVDVGTYQYHLVPDDLKRGWSLVSHQPQPSEKPKSPTEAPVPPPSVTETVAASRPISETEETEPKPAVPPPSVMETVAASAPDIPSITPSTAAVLSMSTVGPVMYHSEMAQIQERMSSTRQAKTESAVWVKLMNERHNIIQKAGEGYGLKLNGISLGADRTLRLGRSAYTTQGLFFTHSDAKLNFRGKAIGGGNLSSWSAGTYAAYYHDSGFWLDGILKANRFSQEIYGKMTGGGDAFGNFSTLAFGATVRGGKDRVVGDMTFTPYLSLSGLRTTRSSLSLSNGMKGDISAQRSVLGKVGLRALYQTRIKDISVTPWIDVGAEREFIKNNRVRINQLDSFDNDLSGITGAYSLGLSANMSETFNVSATAGYKKGAHIESPWNASIGMNLKF